jgi:hypothetical protein
VYEPINRRARAALLGIGRKYPPAWGFFGDDGTADTDLSEDMDEGCGLNHVLF